MPGYISETREIKPINYRQMRRLTFWLFFFLLSCNYNRNNSTNKGTKQTIALLNLGDDQPHLARLIKSRLEDSIYCNVLLLDTKPLPLNAYNSSRKRYKADSLLVFLNKHKPAHAQKIIGITAEDIETRNGIIKSWCVMGLGYCPGTSCIVSSFRTKKTAKTQNHLHDRMVKLVLHELGHTYSLDHCSDTTCIMQDAKGEIRLDNSAGYCQHCKQALKGKGFVLKSNHAQGYSQHTENK